MRRLQSNSTNPQLNNSTFSQLHNSATPHFFPTTQIGTKLASGLIYARSAVHYTHACALQAFHLA
ncbi:MAG: hypothetical protein IPG18_00775 [Saprospiraceae bacterium]|nr:hypothetical protein [Saprospiraceae bacterium]